MEAYTTDSWFIKVKGHKDNFASATGCRLINPAKTDIWKVSKQITENIVQNVNKTLNYKLYKNTTDVTYWFTSLPEKKIYIYTVQEFLPVNIRANS